MSLGSRASLVSAFSRQDSKISGWDKISQLGRKDSRFVSFSESPDAEQRLETRSRISTVLAMQDAKFIRKPIGPNGPRLNPLPYRHKQVKSTIPRYVPPPIPEEPVFYEDTEKEFNKKLPRGKRPSLPKFKGKTVPPSVMISTTNGDQLTCHIIGKPEPMFDPEYSPERRVRKSWDMKDPGTSYSQRIRTPPPLPPSLRETKYRHYMHQHREATYPLKFTDEEKELNQSLYRGKEYWKNRVVRSFKPKVSGLLNAEMAMMQSTTRNRRIEPIKRVALETLSSSTSSVCTY